APWYVIPANRKWFRNWAISKIITNTLIQMKINHSKSSPHHKNIKI
ncbi:MAG: polyphosphate kinase 2 family protein, partial [Nitrosopumilales archaeon]